MDLDNEDITELVKNDIRDLTHKIRMETARFTLVSFHICIYMNIIGVLLVIWR